MQYRCATLFSMLMAVCLLALVPACGGGGNIGLVKGGLLGTDQRLTVGEALDHYGFFKSCRWEESRSDNGIQFVNAIGEFDFSKIDNGDVLSKRGLLRKLEAVFQFTVNRDGKTFEVSTVKLQVVTKDGQTMDIDAWKKLLGEREDARIKALPPDKISEYQQNRPQEAEDEWKARWAAPCVATPDWCLEKVYANQLMLHL